MERFETPIVVFFFKRDKVIRIIERIAAIQPTKVYLISDAGRTEEEQRLVRHCRELVERRIDWPCEIIRNYADENRGVYDRIGLGARWVLERERRAIFLEDDNLPDLTFFAFCQELLVRYADDDQVLWICGTNYLRGFETSDGSDYMFTRHMLPCGWASWSHKFLRYYDGEVAGCDNPELIKAMKRTYPSSALAKQQIRSACYERSRIHRGLVPTSWDFQMDFAIHANGLLGISPRTNLIENIGVDEHSIHGGTTLNNVMVKRFCGIPTKPIQTPLRHPQKIEIDEKYERAINRIVLLPFTMRFRSDISGLARKILRIPEEMSIRSFLFTR